MSPEQMYGGRYAVQESVGSGGMAEVYRGRDQLLGREVAVKVLAERFAQDRSFVERFRREAQSAANLNHPNIVSLYDYGSDDHSYYIVMEFIDGRSLADILSQEGRVMPERAAEIAADVARALARAHAQGIVHRDIKPGNIMITSSGQTKVTDFGIARAVGGDGEATVTQTGMVIGTAAYLSPEQAQGNPVDARSDVYSLGIVLYEMLTGSQPFTGETPLAVAYKHVREDAPPLTTLNPDVPRELAAITSKALAKNPDNRYSSATEMLEDLDRFLAGQTVLAPPMMGETMVAPATGTQVLAEEYAEEEEPEERNTAAYVIGALLLLALFGLIAFFLWRALAPGAEVEVPEVVGMQEDEARATLEEENLEVEVERRFNEADPGEVFRQDPEAGEIAREGDAVVIFVSRGERQVEVPDVVGMTLQQARQVLRDEGLRVGDVTREPSEEAEEDEVLRQSVQPGVEVPARTEIDLVVSEGAGTVEMLNVIGQDEDTARANLESLGLEVQTEQVESTESEGIVVDQDPSAGEEVERGSTVTIFVSEGTEREMPDMRGREADQAQAELEDDYGLNVEQRDETQPCAEPPGYVCRQDPQPGETVRPGDQAILYVQEGAGQVPGGFGFAGFALLLALFA